MKIVLLTRKYQLFLDVKNLRKWKLLSNKELKETSIIWKILIIGFGIIESR